MSNAGSKMDVEDVLSSIRRLVSEEARTVVDEEIAPADEGATDSSVAEPDAEAISEPDIESVPEKLVLTTAFRVAENKNASPDTSEIEKRIADIETLVLSEAEEPSQSVSSEPADELSEVTEQMPPTAEAKAEPFVVRAPSFEELSEKTVVTEAPALNLTEADIVAPDAETFDDQPEEAADSETEVAFEAETPDAPDPVEDTAEAYPDEEPEPEEDPADPARLREIVDTIDGPIEPEEVVDYTAEADTFLDEEALREIVSEMVRSELQGELGDRITRNVRKLVRREIHRALASRDFE